MIYIFYQLFALYWAGGFAVDGIVGYILILQMIYITMTEEQQPGRTTRLLLKVTPWMLAVLALAALAFSYIPEHDEARNLDLQETLAVAPRLDPERDLMIGPGGDLTSEYWLYFAPDRKIFWLKHHEPPRGTPDSLRAGAERRSCSHGRLGIATGDAPRFGQRRWRLWEIGI